MTSCQFGSGKRVFPLFQRRESLFHYFNMADLQCDKQIKKRKELSFGSSSLLISSKEICSNVDEQFELSWPAADEQDSTQIQKEDPTPQYPEGNIRHCPEVAFSVAPFQANNL